MTRSRARLSFRSFREPHIDTATSGERSELLVAFIAKVADLERHRIRERVMAGLDRTKAEGKTLGRSSIAVLGHLYCMNFACGKRGRKYIGTLLPVFPGRAWVVRKLP